MVRTFVWFCSREDYHLLLRSIQSVIILFPAANIVVFDNTQGGKTLSMRATTALKRLGAIVVPVTLPNARNGHWKASNRITSLRWASDITGADIIVHLTPGTIVLNTGWLAQLTDRRMDATCTGHGSPLTPDARISAWTPEALRIVGESLDTDLVPDWDTDENFEIAARFHRLFPEDRRTTLEYSRAGVHPSSPHAVAGAWRATQGDEQWLVFVADRWQFVDFSEAEVIPIRHRVHTMKRLLAILNAQALTASPPSRIVDAGGTMVPLLNNTSHYESNQ